MECTAVTSKDLIKGFELILAFSFEHETGKAPTDTEKLNNGNVLTALCRSTADGIELSRMFQL